jgi:alkylation response protein AidB-like acyl-CoA dehydrogenase
MKDAVSIATMLADEFRTRAADYDRTGEFPTKNYERMRETGYLRAPVPVELGGGGAGLVEMSLAQQALARGCASTALAVNMHLFQLGTMADAYRNGGPTGPILKRVADEGIVIASNGAESFVVGEWTTPTTATRRNGSYVIDGRKYFCSQAPGADVVRFLARDTDTGETLIVGVGTRTPGFKVVETWDTTGMRATASHDVVFESMEVPESAVGARIPADVKEPLRGAVVPVFARWFHTMAAGVYIGIAEEAREEAYKALGTGINSAFREQALTDVMIGEMEAAYLTAVSVRDQVAAAIEEPPKDMQWCLMQTTLLKEIVVDRAIAVVEKAVELAGGRAYFRKSPLERLARDVRAGRFHPLSAPVSFQVAGQRGREARQSGEPAAAVRA